MPTAAQATIKTLVEELATAFEQNTRGALEIFTKIEDHPEGLLVVTHATLPLTASRSKMLRFTPIEHARDVANYIEAELINPHFRSFGDALEQAAVAAYAPWRERLDRAWHESIKPRGATR